MKSFEGKKEMLVTNSFSPSHNVSRSLCSQDLKQLEVVGQRITSLPDNKQTVVINIKIKG